MFSFFLRDMKLENILMDDLGEKYGVLFVCLPEKTHTRSFWFIALSLHQLFEFQRTNYSPTWGFHKFRDGQRDRSP